MGLNAARALQRLGPEAAPLVVVLHLSFRVGTAADDKLGVEGASGRSPGLLIPQVQTPAHVTTEIWRGAVRRLAMHKEDPAFSDRDWTRGNLRQQIRSNRRAALGLML